MSAADVVAVVDGARKVDRRSKSNGDGHGKPLAFTWAKDFPAVTVPEMTVERTIGAGTLVQMFGDSNTGKSTLGLDVGLHVATARPWRGRRTRKGVVIWLGLEAAAGTRRRVAAHCRHYGIEAGRLLFADVTTALQLLELHDVTALIATVKAAEADTGEKCALVVVDTLARAMAGHDENAAQDMGLLVKGCDLVRAETGATVLLIHHSGKDPTKGARGSGSLRAAVDTEIEVSGQQNPRQAKVTKQRDLPSGDVFLFDLEPVEIGRDPDTGEPFTSCVVVHRGDGGPVLAEPKGRAVGSIMRALRAQQAEQGKAPRIWTLEDMRQIGRNLGQHRNTARDAVDRLIGCGLLVPTIGGYRLAEASSEVRT